MKAWLESEDGWAVLLGVALVALGVSALAGADVLGWVVSTHVWIDLSKAMSPASGVYAGLPGARLALVYVVCLFGFVIWIGLVISWLFFHGVLPRVVPGGL